MKSRFLFPSIFRRIGWVLFPSGFLLTYLVLYHNYIIPFLRDKSHISNGYSNFMPFTRSYTDELAFTMVIIGLSFIAFSRLKKEDELVSKLRLDALYWAILVNYLIYILYILLVPSWEESSIHLVIYNLFTPLLIFIFRFHFLIYLKKDSFIISKLRFLPYLPFRIIAVSISLICFLFGTVSWVTKTPFPAVMNSMALPGIIFGLLLWAYSENKNEDELTMQYRLESMQLAVFINYGILLIVIFTVYRSSFLTAIFLNFISLLLFFVIRFAYVCTKNNWTENKQARGGLLS